MTASAAETLLTCAECGAVLPPGAASCWLCRCKLDSPPPIVMAEVVSHPHFAPSEIVFAVATFLFLFVIVLLAIGCFLTAPGLGIAYLLFATPPVIITLIRAQKLKAKRGSVTWGDRLLTLILSTAMSVLVALLLAVAAFIAFFVWCWYAILSGNF